MAMQKWKQKLLVLCVLAAVTLSSIVIYSFYIETQIRETSTYELLATYEQVNKTFRMFASRNWNVLNEWGKQLSALETETEVRRELNHYAKEERTWKYSSMYLFNEEGQIYWAMEKAAGSSDLLAEYFTGMYQTDGPIVTSYRLSNSVRKVVFAVPTDPIVMEGVEYTAIAVSYDNDTLEELVGGKPYEGHSDCYVIRPNGDIVLSEEEKSEIEAIMDNLFDYIEQYGKVDAQELSAARQDVQDGQTGRMNFWFDGEDYYMVYQPVGIQGFSLVGVVPCKVVDAGMIRIRNATMFLLVLLAGSALLVIIWLLRMEYAERIQEKEGKLQEESAHRAKMETLAHTDNLTGLHNERFFNSFLEQKKTRPEAFALFYLDLDEFKQVNDTYGHDMGNQLLREVAHRLRECVRSNSTDVICRIGGDEFAIICRGYLDKELCRERAMQIEQSICRPYQLAGKTIRIGVSCGYAIYPLDGLDVDDIRIRADQRMYENKMAARAER